MADYADVFLRGEHRGGWYAECNENTRDGRMDSGVEEQEPYEAADNKVEYLAFNMKCRS